MSWGVAAGRQRAGPGDPSTVGCCKEATMAKESSSVCGELAALVLAATAATAQTVPGNMLTNGAFDGATVSPWTTWFLTSSLTYDASDADGCSASGSGLVTHNEGQFTTIWFDQCVSGVSDAELYDFGARLLFPAADPDGNGYVLVYWYSGTDCTGTFTASGTPWLLGSEVTGTWTAAIAKALAPDPGTASARVRLSVRRTSPNSATPLTVHFDGVFFAPTGGIWLDGFENGDTCRWFQVLP